MSESARRFGSQSRLRQSIRETALTLKVREINGGMGGSDDGGVIPEHTDPRHDGDQELHLK